MGKGRDTRAASWKMPRCQSLGDGKEPEEPEREGPWAEKRCEAPKAEEGDKVFQETGSPVKSCCRVQLDKN